MSSYITADEAAGRWGISGVRVRQLCRAGRVPGAYRSDDRSASWLVPADAEKPEKMKPGRKVPSRKSSPEPGRQA